VEKMVEKDERKSGVRYLRLRRKRCQKREAKNMTTEWERGRKEAEITNRRGRDAMDRGRDDARCDGEWGVCRNARCDDDEMKEDADADGGIWMVNDLGTGTDERWMDGCKLARIDAMKKVNGNTWKYEVDGGG
jgi:hypothetical protein